MNKPFSNLINKDKDKNTSLSKKFPEKKENEKSNLLIIFGAAVSLISIFLLLYTINSKFG